jgi:hypothetical protein
MSWLDPPAARERCTIYIWSEVPPLVARIGDRPVVISAVTCEKAVAKAKRYIDNVLS